MRIRITEPSHELEGQEFIVTLTDYLYAQDLEKQDYNCISADESTVYLTVTDTLWCEGEFEILDDSDTCKKLGYYDEDYNTFGERVIDDFVNGNFSDAVKELQDNAISIQDFIEFLEGRAEWYETSIYEVYGGHFGASFWVSLGSSYYK